MLPSRRKWNARVVVPARQAVATILGKDMVKERQRGGPSGSREGEEREVLAIVMIISVSEM